ncbi:MAG: sulfite exporter TauE/SafE family protein [Cyanobacteria bacterium P01_E01_bin.6]
MSDLLLIFTLGFLGSFGHCVSMCGPLTVAFSLTNAHQPSIPNQSGSSHERRLSSRWQHIRFHLLLNLGRLLSYTLVGLILGTVGAMVVWSGQLAGVGSGLRRAIALLTGMLLIWFGVRQTFPTLLPSIPLRLLGQLRIHQWIDRTMKRLATGTAPWKPAALGMAWGLMPCGFLFAAQLKAAGESDPLMGAWVMLFFGLGTLPTMVGIGVTSSLLSQNRRSQLFRAGGAVAIAIGILTVLRTGDLMVDYTAYGAMLCLMLALIARPIRRLWAAPMHYRRALGVGGFLLSVAHIIHRLEHTWDWKLDALFFMTPAHQQGIFVGFIGILLLIPLAATSFDGAQRYLGSRWRSLHLLSVPALLLATLHTVMVGSSFLGSFQLTWLNYALTGLLLCLVVGVLFVRSPWFWSILSIKQFYAIPHSASIQSNTSTSPAAPNDTHCHDAGSVAGATKLRPSDRNG